MAGLDDFCGNIAGGFDPCGKTPSVAGIEPGVYVGNKDEWTFTFNATNPLIVIGLTPVGSALLYKLKGFGDSFDAMSKVVKKATGPLFAETINAYISDNSTDTKKIVVNGAKGRQFYIVVNNDKATDGAIELFGAVHGLQFSENTQRQASDEDMSGAWKIEAINPAKLLEPYPPRAVLIPPGSGSATYASTIAALEALLS